MKKNSKKIWSILFLLVIMFTTFGGTFTAVKAMTNPNYQQFINSTDYAIDEVIESSTILDLLGSFIYALGNIVEKIVSDIMAVGGGGKFFPWSDLIVFNAIPLLDVNYINPDPKSLVSDVSPFGQVIRNIYFSGMSIALGFLGIIVAVMAIKLALSTIAADKAKYKEAIVKWLTALVLLFGMHFVLSFLFYMNELLVEKASEILINSIETNAEEIVEILKANLVGKEDKIVKNFTEAAEPGFGTLLAQSIHIVTVGSINPILGGLSFMRIVLDNAEDLDDSDYLNREANRHIAYALISNSTIRKNVLSHVSGNAANKDKPWYEKMWDGICDFAGTVASGESAAAAEKRTLITYVNVIKQAKNWTPDEARQAKEKLSSITGTINNQTYSDKEELEKAQTGQVVLSMAIANYDGKDLQGDDEGPAQIISLLGEFFKTNAWYTDVDNGGWSPTNISITAAILYTMLVFQSVGFLVSYVKRLVIVIVLSIISPFVVIYDFFTKSMQI